MKRSLESCFSNSQSSFLSSALLMICQSTIGGSRSLAISSMVSTVPSACFLVEGVAPTDDLRRVFTIPLNSLSEQRGHGIFDRLTIPMELEDQLDLSKNESRFSLSVCSFLEHAFSC